jgi:hypothetical protein
VSLPAFSPGHLYLAALLALLTLLPARLVAPKTEAPVSQPQGGTIRIPINVHDTSLPITIGVPVSEAAKLYDPSWLGVTDANGVPTPAQMRVLARWRGVANEAARPIKWLLVDFKPTVAGLHFVAPAARADIPPVTITDASGAIRVTNSRIEIELSKSGEELVKSFKLGGQEQLRAPVTAQAGLPRRALITRVGQAPDIVTVNDTALLKAGDVVRFERVDTLKWDAPAGSQRVVVHDWNFKANRRYRLDEGTGQQEDVEVVWAEAGDLRAATKLRFSHSVGATIRDLMAEQETATIKSVSGQTVQFTAPLKFERGINEKLIALNAADQIARAVIERTIIEESNPLRVIVRQDGAFRCDFSKSASSKALPTMTFTLRYYIYANQPFVRVRLRMMNNGVFGFGAYRSWQPPFPQHAILRSLSVLLPTVTPASGVSQVLNSNEARDRLSEKQSGASLVAGLFEVAVPEFVENYPKALRGSSSGIRFDLLPDTGEDYIFDGARAKTTDFYIGQQTIKARALTNSSPASLDPAYIATTGAVRPAFVESRDWRDFFGKDEVMSEAANRVERMLASGYAVEATDDGGAVPPSSIFEYRNRGENGEQFGWRNFGDLAWGDGYANVHYDLPFVLLREYLRTGDARAFKLGSEMARYRADWGHYRADDFLTVEKTWNFKGLAFYEKGDHGAFKEPVPSHSWIEGMWLYWALTGDETARESAVEGADAFLRMNFTYANALGWNEPRWVGWPAHGLMVAYRYTGDARYLNKARDDVYLLVQAEESFGRKGYYISYAPNVIQATQPWAWCYSQLGVIEYWRETGDKRVADYLVRIADWLINKENPPIKPGSKMPDGTYLPNGISYFWTPDKVAADRSVALAGLALPVLVTAARISSRADLRARAQEVFRDYAFYRDFPEGKSIASAARHIINFRSLQYPASATKVYGQMGLTVSEYLADIANSIVAPGQSTSAQPTPQALDHTTNIPTSSSRTPPTPNLALANVALNRPATASSVRQWSDVIGVASAANDGQSAVSGKNSAWHSDSNTGKLEWWQVDLGKKYQIASVEIVFRNDQDQPITRRNFEVLGSNDPSFKTSTKLAERGETPVPFKQTWQAGVTVTEAFRYIRVQKTKIDKDAYGQSFFTFEEARVFAHPFRSVSTLAPQPDESQKPVALNELKAQKLLVGQSLYLALARTDERGVPLQLYAYNLPAGAAFDPSAGVFLFTPNSKQAGNVYQISFRAINQRTNRSARLDIAVVIDGAPQITLVEPGNSASSLSSSKPFQISWSTSHSARMKKYQIRLSTDGGASYPIVIADLPGDAREFQWTIPKSFPATNRAQIRFMIKGVDEQGHIGVDFSKQNLRITK